MDFVRLARLGKPFGLNGVFKAHSLTDFPEKRFKKGVVFSLLNEKTGERLPKALTSYRLSKGVLYLGFEGIVTPEDALNYQGYFVEIEKEKAPLPKGYYRLEELKGLSVYDEKGTLLGKVTGIQDYAPTINLIVSREGKNPFYVPFLFDVFVQSVDLEVGKIVIRPIGGML